MTDLAEQLKWIETLVGLDTTSRHSNLSLIETVEAYLSGFGIAAQRVPDDSGEKSNLYAIIGPEVDGGVVLSGHSDVVPVDGQAWSSDPFTLTRRGDRFYGRGSADMKSFPAITLSLVPEIIAADLRHPIILALSYDEEVGCLGAPRMIERIRQELPVIRAVIVGEPTEMKVVDGHKGIASFRTTVTGFTTHSSQTERGVSAVEYAARLVGWIADRRLENRAGARPDCPFMPPYTTATVNVMHGGSQLNIMAAEASFEWDLRALPSDSPADFFADFTAYASALQTQMRAINEQCAITTEQLTNAPPLAPRENNPAAALCQQITGHNSTDVVGYAAEAGQFQTAGYDTVICGPGSIDQAHQADEFITLDQIAAGTRFQRALIAHLSR